MQAGGRSAAAELCAQVQYAQGGVFDELEGFGRADFALAFDQARGGGEVDGQPVVAGCEAVCQLGGGFGNVGVVHGCGDCLHHAFARFHENGGGVCQRVGGCDGFDGEAAAAAAFVFAADAAGPHAFCAEGQVGQVGQAVAEEGDGKGERFAGCVAGAVVEGRADGIGPAQVAAGLLILRHGQQLADGTDRCVQYAGLLVVGSVASFRAEGTVQDVGECAAHCAALEGMPEDRLLGAAVEGEMVDGEGDVKMRGHAAFFSSHLFTGWPGRTAHIGYIPGCCAPCGRGG